MEKTFNYDNKSVLIIDDQPENLQVITEFLENNGIETMIAKNGFDGITRAIKGHPDLILLDIRMPDIDGYETCYRLKSEPLTKDIPVIYMTVMSEIDEKLKAFALGGVDYITKPFNEHELLARINVHLQSSSITKTLTDDKTRLTNALDTGNVVNLAVGMLMERQGIKRDEAFEMIRKKARSKSQKVSVIANELLSNTKL